MSFHLELQKLLGSRRVRFDAATLQKHSTDAWLASHPPEAVVFADNTRCVQEVLKFASRRKIPVTVRGGGVGYVGGCVPVRGGIVLSLAKLRRILEIHAEDGVAVVEPGVLTSELQDAARRQKLFYPPDPASFRECSIGGNIATNAGGPRCLRYGVTRHYVLGLQVVLPTGELLQLGSRTHKNKTGFDLMGMFVGSEGLLGVVTQATLRLLPHPPARAALSAGFRDERQAARAVQMILQSGFLPSALEIADRLTLAAARRHAVSVQKSLQLNGEAPVDVPPGNGVLILEIDGQHAAVRKDAHALQKILKKAGARSIRMATSSREFERIWDLRRAFSFSLKATGLRKLNEDVTVPRSRLVDLFDFGRHLQKKYGIQVACFGHAGDGNIHVNLMIDTSDRRQVRESKAALDQLFRQILRWGGVITGEHGIGLAKKRWWPLAVSPGVRQFHERLKAFCDPKGILNPGKFVGR